MIDTERGFMSVKSMVDSGAVERFDARSYEQVEEAYWHIKRNQQDYCHVVIDTFSALSRITLQDLTIDPSRATDGPSLWATRLQSVPDKRSYGIMGDRIVRLRALFASLEIPTIYVCHEEETEEEDGFSFQIIMAASGKIAKKDLWTNADAVLRLVVLSDKMMVNGMECPAGTRVLRLNTNGKIAAGYRGEYTDIPDLLPNPSLAKLEELFGEIPHSTVIYGNPKLGKTTLTCKR